MESRFAVAAERSRSNLSNSDELQREARADQHGVPYLLDSMNTKAHARSVPRPHPNRNQT